MAGALGGTCLALLGGILHTATVLDDIQADLNLTRVAMAKIAIFCPLRRTQIPAPPKFGRDLAKVWFADTLYWNG